MKANWKYLLAVLIAVAGSLGIGIAVGDDGNSGHTITIHVPSKGAPTATPVAQGPTGPTGPSGPAGELQSTAKDIEQLQDPIPDDIPKPVLEKAEEHNDAMQDTLPSKPVPVGGAQNYRIIRQSPLTTLGFGSYRSKINEFCLHYTVSYNIPHSLADITSVEAYLKKVGLNATYLADFDGHIYQAGPTDRNPYTQGWFNQYCESVEIIAYGTETKAQWMASPLIKDRILSSFVRDRLLARGLPLKFVDPSGCNAPLGWTDHYHLECGNDHHDVEPNFPYAVFQRQLTTKPRVRISKRDRSRCKFVHDWRGRKHHTKKGTARKIRYQAAQRARGHKCVGGKTKQA